MWATTWFIRNPSRTHLMTFVNHLWEICDLPIICIWPMYDTSLTHLQQVWDPSEEFASDGKTTHCSTQPSGAVWSMINSTSVIKDSPCYHFSLPSYHNFCKNCFCKAENIVEHTAHQDKLNLSLHVSVYGTPRLSKQVRLALCAAHFNAPGVNPSKWAKAEHAARLLLSCIYN